MRGQSLARRVMVPPEVADCHGMSLCGMGPKVNPALSLELKDSNLRLTCAYGTVWVRTEVALVDNGCQNGPRAGGES